MHWVKAITFDFWGTLVDVDASGEVAMRQLVATFQPGLDLINPAALYLAWDAATVRRYRSDVWRPYVEWSAMGLKDTFAPYGIHLSDAAWYLHADAFVRTMTSQASPHPEVPAIINALKRRFPLMPIINMDASYFRLNPFHAVFEQFS